MSEKSLIQLRASYFVKGHILSRAKDEEVFDYPKLVYPQKPINELTNEITRDEARAKLKEENGSVYSSCPEDHDYFEVVEDFYYYDPCGRSGFSLDGAYVSGADWDIEMIGPEDVFEDSIEEIHKDFAPLFKKAISKVKAEDMLRLEVVVQCPAVMEFNSHYDYFGEYDCWTEYMGLLDTTQLGTILRKREGLDLTVKEKPIVLQTLRSTLHQLVDE